MPVPSQAASSSAGPRTALLAGAVLVVFGPGLLGDFVRDDRPLLRDHEALGDLRTLPARLTRDFWDVPARGDLDPPRSLYRPVATGVWALERAAFGPNPLPFHALDLAVHLAALLLAAGFLRRRTGAGTASAGELAVLCGVALFALHPSRLEAVSWVSGGPDVLMAALLLGALALRDASTGPRGTAGAAALLVLSLLAKETAAAAALLLATDALLLPESAPGARRRSLLLAGVLAIATALRLALGPHAGAPIDLRPGEAGLRLLAATGLYAKLVLMPWPVTVRIPFGPEGAGDPTGYAAWSVALGALIWAGAAALAVAARRRPAVRPWLADLLWFLAPLVPVSGLSGAEGTLSARYLYLPLIGLASVLVRALLHLRPVRAARPVWALAGGAVLLCAALTAASSDAFADERALWRRERRLHPDDAVVALEAGRDALAADRAAAAQVHLSAAVRHARSPDVRAEAALLLASAQLQGYPVPEPPVAGQLREFAEALAAGRLPARLPLPEGPVEVSPTPDGLARLRARPVFARLRTDARLAAGDPAGAAEAARAALPGRVDAGLFAGLLRALLLTPALDEAAATLAQARGAIPGFDADGAWAARLEQATQAVHAADPAAGAVAFADLDLALRAPGAAVARLEPLLALPDPPAGAYLVRARAEALQGRLDAAERILGEGLARRPGEAELTVARDSLRRMRALADPGPGAGIPGEGAEPGGG